MSYWEINKIILLPIFLISVGCSSSTGRKAIGTGLGATTSAVASGGDIKQTIVGGVTGLATTALTEAGMEKELAEQAQAIRDKAKSDMVKQTHDLINRVHRAKEKNESSEEQEFRRVQYLIPSQSQNPNVKTVPHDVAITIEEPK